jgi:hypothetical protein
MRKPKTKLRLYKGNECTPPSFGYRVFDKVKWLSPNDRFVIALRSPRDMGETALARWLREKTGLVFHTSVMSGRFLWCCCGGMLAKLPQFFDVSAEDWRDSLQLRLNGGEGGIRTPDTGVSPYNGLANRRLQPLGHLSGGQS